MTSVSRDPELDRLKAEQDRAFRRKQSTYEAMDAAWKRRSAAREALDRAHSVKQQAWELQNSAWQDLQWTRDRNGPRIDSLNSQQENAFQNMKDAFDRASSAHDARDGASARMYADDGHRYKQEAQDAVAERRRLVQEIRDARDRHNDTKPAFQHAKSQFDNAKRAHDQARDDHQRKQADFKQAKAEFDAAVAAFKKRLETVRAERERRRQDKRSVAERAGVPAMYRDNVWVSRQPDGSYNIYFGGVGKPNGPGHGHYVMDRGGNVTYSRDPFDPHGAENFVEDGRNGPNEDRARRAGKAAEGLVTAAFGVFGALTNPGMAASALPGTDQASRAHDSARQLGDMVAQSERDRRSAEMDRETRAAGDRRGWSGSQK